MVFFLPKEVKSGEGRFSSIPLHVFEYARAGAKFYIEKGAGEKSGFPDECFKPTEFFDTSKKGVWLVERPRDEKDFGWLMRPDRHLSEHLAVLKVKELLPEEYHFIRPRLPIISFGHLASNRQLTEFVIKRGGTYLSLEDIVENGKRPVLAKMSEIAGEEAVHLGMQYLSQKKFQSFIVGCGNVGKAAQKKLLRISAVPIIYDKARTQADEKHEWDQSGQFHAILNVQEMLQCVFEAMRDIVKRNPDRNFEEPILLILAPYIPEQNAPKIITNEMRKLIPPSSVIVDVSIDQGGACEFSQVTTLENPAIELERGIKYIGITNLPGGVPNRSTPVFSESVFPYMMQIIKLGSTGALKENPALRNAVSIYDGKVTSKGLAKTFGLKHTPIETLL